MSGTDPVNISSYFEYFKDQHEKIVQVRERLHRKLLVVTFLSALAEGRYPHISLDREKFLTLIQEHSGWADSNRVSISQLYMSTLNRSSTSSNLSETFIASIEDRYERWIRRRNPSEVFDLNSDPEPESILSISSTTAEKKLVHDFCHLSLLYVYRCKLVHEFREPGYGFEFNESHNAPFYHSLTDLDDGSTEMELVYPTQWFVNLAEQILESLEAQFTLTKTDPYAAYRFGSPWR